MSIFDFATVAVSLILGLAVACLLESMVEAFRQRRLCRLDWLPFVCATCVVVQQFQFWWALYELQAMPSMSALVFTILLLLAALLFLAGALVLPSGGAAYPDDLAEYFAVDGSWGAAALALYNVVALVANIAIFHEPVVSAIHLLNVALALVAVLLALTQRRRWLITLTLLYAAILVVGVVASSSAVYESAAAT